MLSYFPNKGAKAHEVAIGWKTVDTTDLQHIAKGVSLYPWSPCIWQNGMRLQKNFILARICALDFDDGEMSLEEALNDFCDMRCIIGTTKSHQKDKHGLICDRFRVLFFWPEVISDFATYKYNMVTMLKAYPVDNTCKDGARFFFPCKEIVFINENKDSYFLDIKKKPKNFEDPEAPFAINPQKAKLGIIPSSVTRHLARCYKPHKRNHATYGAIMDLIKNGYTSEEILLIIQENEDYADDPLPKDELTHQVRFHCHKHGVK